MNKKSDKSESFDSFRQRSRIVKGSDALPEHPSGPAASSPQVKVDGKVTSARRWKNIDVEIGERRDAERESHADADKDRYRNLRRFRRTDDMAAEPNREKGENAHVDEMEHKPAVSDDPPA